MKLINNILILLALPFAAYGSPEFYGSNRIGDAFVPHHFEKEALGIKIGGELLYMAQTMGAAPELGRYSPGYRFTASTSLPGSFDVTGAYTSWTSEKNLSFQIPILQRLREIDTEESIDNVELAVGRSISLFKGTQLRPYAGVEWDRNATKVTIDKEWEILSSQHGVGPLTGIELKQKVFKYFELMGSLSFSYLDASYQRKVIDGTSFKEDYWFPRSKWEVGAQMVIPFKNGKGSFHLKGGYEAQASYLKGKSPDALQGLTLQAGLDF